MKILYFVALYVANGIKLCHNISRLDVPEYEAKVFKGVLQISDGKLE